jgi:hypothetical protein
LERKGVDQRVNMEQDRMMQPPRKLGYRKVKKNPRASVRPMSHRVVAF